MICTFEVEIDNKINKKIKNIKQENNMENLIIEKSITDKIIIDEIKKLPKNYWDFKGENTQELTHGLHSYPAMMLYHISRNIIKIMRSIMPVDTILDPFAGSGTVLVEGVLAGIKNVYGNDLNPLCKLLSSVKTYSLDTKLLTENYQKLLKDINTYSKYNNDIKRVNDYFTNDLGIDLTAKDGWGKNAYKYLSKFYNQNDIELYIPNFKNIGYWFKPSVIMELQIIKNAIKNIKNVEVQNFFWVAFSETIRLVSNRRNGEFKMFRMDIKKLASFNPDVRTEFYKILKRNLNKMQTYSEICHKLNNASKVKMLLGNSSNLKGVPDESVDIVITSPPYGDSRTTVAYGEYSRLSLQWMDLYELTDKDIMGIDKKLMGGIKYKNGFEYILQSETLKASLDKIRKIDLERAGDVFSFYKDLDIVIQEVAKKTKVNGYQFWVVGNRTVKNENLKTDRIIRELAEKYKLKYIYTIDRNISNKVMPSKNSPSNNVGDKVTTIVMEHIIVFKKTI